MFGIKKKKKVDDIVGMGRNTDGFPSLMGATALLYSFLKHSYPT